MVYHLDFLLDKNQYLCVYRLTSLAFIDSLLTKFLYFLYSDTPSSLLEFLYFLRFSMSSMILLFIHGFVGVSLVYLRYFSAAFFIVSLNFSYSSSVLSAFLCFCFLQQFIYFFIEISYFFIFQLIHTLVPFYISVFLSFFRLKFVSIRIQL